MPHNVRTNLPLVQLPKGPGSDTQRVEGSGTTVLLTDDEYNRLLPTAFSSGDLTDLGVVGLTGDAVAAQATHVAAAAALTSAAAAGATPTKAEHDAVVNDLVALRSTLNAALAALTGPGKPMA